MSDLEGLDAFTTVLDRMVEAELKIARLEAQNSTVSRDVRSAEGMSENLSNRNKYLTEEMAALRNDLAALKAKHDKAIRLGMDLWEAARNVVNKPDQGEYEKLKVAMEAARDPFDDIPF